MSKKAPRESRKPLNQPLIVAAAIALADQSGIEQLSMRNLAKRLECKTMSLYTHVSNKDELLSLMADEVAAKVEHPSEDLGPLAAVRALAVSTQSTLATHVWSSALWLEHLPGPKRTGHMELSLRLMYSSGFPRELAHYGFHAVNNHVLGYTLQEIGPTMNIAEPEKVMADYIERTDEEMFPLVIEHVHEHMRGESGSSFEFVLDLILTGLEQLNQ